VRIGHAKIRDLHIILWYTLGVKCWHKHAQQILEFAILCNLYTVAIAFITTKFAFTCYMLYDSYTGAMRLWVMCVITCYAPLFSAHTIDLKLRICYVNLKFIKEKISSIIVICIVACSSTVHIQYQLNFIYITIHIHKRAIRMPVQKQ